MRPWAWATTTAEATAATESATQQSAGEWTLGEVPGDGRVLNHRVD